MRFRGLLIWAVLVLLLRLESPAQQPEPPYAAQIRELTKRAALLDTDNRQLQTRLAQSQQQVKLLRDQIDLLQKRLAETTDKLQSSQLAKQDTDRRLQALLTSTQHRGGATITANTNASTTLSAVEIPGLEVRQEADVIRIEIPSEKLFQPVTPQLIAAAYPVLDQVASVITRNYPNQIIGIEGHTDASILATPNLNPHQLTGYQAMAVLDVFVGRNGIPAQQLFAVAHGTNHPRVANATNRTANRRIEIVIYPEVAAD